MQVTNIQASNLSDIWFKLLDKVVDSGRVYEVGDGPYAGKKRLELEFAVLNVHCPWQKLWPDLEPPLFSIEDFEEYIDWLLSGMKKEFKSYRPTKDYELLFESIPEFSVVKNLDIDFSPIGLLIAKYKRDGFKTNRACIELADKSDIARAFPICIRLIDTKVLYNRLHFFVYFRSWDLWNEFSFDLAVLERIKLYVAERIGVESGELVACSKGIHLYEKSWKKAEEIVGREIQFKL